MPEVLCGYLSRAIPLLLDILVALLVIHEVVAALATGADASPTVRAPKGAICSATADCLANTFHIEARVNAFTLRDFTALLSKFAMLIRSASHLGSETWPLTRIISPFTAHRFMVLEEGPQTMNLPHLPIRSASAGQKNRVERLATETREPYQPRGGSAPLAEDINS